MAQLGWYPDPTRPGYQQYFDGYFWTGQVAPLPTPVYAAPQAYGTTQYVAAQYVDRPAPNGGLVAVAWIVAFLTFLYMLPWAIAATRSKSNQGAIGIVNLLLGWSLIGWVVALVMAASAESAAPMVLVQPVATGVPTWTPPAAAPGSPPWPPAAVDSPNSPNRMLPAPVEGPTRLPDRAVDSYTRIEPLDAPTEVIRDERA